MAEVRVQLLQKPEVALDWKKKMDFVISYVMIREQLLLFD